MPPARLTRVATWSRNRVRIGQGIVLGVAFAADGRHVASAADDGTVRLFDWRAPAAPPMILRTGEKSVNGWRSPLTGTLASAGEDGTVRVFDCQRCGPISRILDLARERLPREIS